MFFTINFDTFCLIPAGAVQDIRDQAIKVLAMLGVKVDDNIISLDTFLLDIDPDIVKSLRFEHNHKNYYKIIKKIIETDKKTELAALINLLQANISLDMVPALMTIIDNGKVIDEGCIIYRNNYIDYELTISDRAVILLENIYNYNYPKKELPDPKTRMFSNLSPGLAYYANRGKTSVYWKDHWQKDSLNYKYWEEDFYKKRLESLEKSDSVTLMDLNSIMRSRYFNVSQRNIWEDGLKKLKCSKDLYNLKAVPRLKVKQLYLLQHLFTEPLNFIVLLDDIDYSSVEEIYNFILDISRTYSDEKKGEMYYRLLSRDYLKNWYRDNDNLFDQDEILKFLDSYINSLNKKTYSYQYVKEEINNFKTINLTFEEKLKKGLSMTIDVDKKNTYIYESDKEKYLKNILSEMDYKDLGIFFKYLDTLRSIYQERDLVSLLRYDFGIPVKNFDKNTVHDLIYNYDENSEQQFYKHIALKFYPDLYKNGKLNNKVVYNALKYDCFREFTGAGSHFEFSVIPVIRLLEIEHNTRLGYTHKFNDHFGLRGYGVDSKAKDWRKFLIDNGFVKPGPNEVPSFDDMPEEPRE